VDIATNPDLFKDHFRVALRHVYPLGREEARHFLIRLRDIRNDVSHGRGCSLRRLEQAICYSNDLIESLQMYFGQNNMQKAFNVPSIIRFSDSLGNTSYLENVPEDVNSRVVDLRRGGHGNLYPGDTLLAEIEVDPSFQENEYDVAWDVFGGENGTGPVARIFILSKHVG
jgi:hypothetical protein